MQKIERFIPAKYLWKIFTLVVLVLSGLWFWRTAVPSDAIIGGLIPSPREGFLAPDFTLETLDGQTITLSDLRGKVVMVNLWASWCPPCRAEMPAIEQIYQANKTRGLEVLAVNTTNQDSEEAAAQFAQDFGLTFPILLDRDGTVSRRYQLQALPSTYFIDRQGVIRAIVPGGPMSETLIQTKIEDLLVEMH